MTARRTKKPKAKAPAGPPTLDFLKRTAPADTVTVACIDGLTGESLGLEIEVATQYSRHARAAQHKAVKHYKADHPDTKATDRDALAAVADLYILAHNVVAWNLSDCPLTPERALEVLSLRGDVFVQVKHAHEESKGFFEPAKAS